MIRIHCFKRLYWHMRQVHRYVLLSAGVYLIIHNATYAQTMDDPETAFYRNRGYTLLSEEQYGDYLPKKYLVKNDIIIPKDSVMVLYLGTTIFINKDKRIVVEGTLQCKGTATDPIIFRALDNDSLFAPLSGYEENRWNGIVVAGTGSVQMHYTILSNSKFGIEAEGDSLHAEIVLNSVLFKDNKYRNVQINGEQISLENNQYISYRTRDKTRKKTEIAPAETSSLNKSVPERSGHKRKNRFKIPVEIGLGCVVLGAAAVAGYYHHEALQYEKEYNTKNEFNSTPEEVAGLHDTIKDNTRWRNIGIVVSGTGALLFVIVIPFSF